MLVSSQFWALPCNFPSCPCTVSWLGRVAPLEGTTLCRFSNNGTPGHYTASEPTTSLNWGVPALATPPQCPRGVLAPRVPFRGSPVPSTLPPWHTAPRAPHQRVTRATAHYAILPPPWALGLPRPTSPVHPLSDTQRYSPFAATLPTRQQGSCTPLSGFRAYIPTNSKTTSILSI